MICYEKHVLLGHCSTLFTDIFFFLLSNAQIVKFTSCRSRLKPSADAETDGLYIPRLRYDMITFLPAIKELSSSLDSSKIKGNKKCVNEIHLFCSNNHRSPLSLSLLPLAPCTSNRMFIFHALGDAILFCPLTNESSVLLTHCFFSVDALF